MIGAATVTGGAFAAGGARALGSAAPAQLIPAEDVAGDTAYAFGHADRAVSSGIE